MNRFLYLSVVLTVGLLFSGKASAQSNYGEIRGKVIDVKTKAPVEFLDVIVQQDGITKGGGFTDENGNYTVKALGPGEYTVTAKHLEYQDEVITGVLVTSNNITYVNIEMRKADATELGEVVKRVYKTPLVEKDKNQKSFSDKDIVKLPTRSIGAIAQTSSAVNMTSGGGISFLGQRTDGTRVFVDGVAVIGSSSLPQAGQGQIDIIQSGVPAQYGDFTGGAINITTKGPSRFYRSSFEIISSSMFDRYHYNHIEYSAVGPLIIKNKGGGEEEYVALGYQFAGNIIYANDPDPRFGGMYVVKDDVLERIKENPLSPNPQGSGFVPSSSFLTANDFVREQARRNVDRLDAIAQGKLEYQPNKNTTITFYGSYNYTKALNFNYTHYLLNNEENSQTTLQTYRTYLKFTQRLRTQSADDKENEKKSLISDAFYTVRLDYQTYLTRTENPRHKDNIFDYGYVGQFTSHKAPAYTYQTSSQVFIDQKGDTVTRRGYWELTNKFVDTLITFRRSELNPLRANYTTNFFDNADELGQTVRFQTQILEGLGLLNGFSIPNTYSLWYNPGTVNVFFEKTQYERFTAYAMGEATLNLTNSHDLQFGIQYEQNIASRYAVGATQLWQLMPLLTNRHIEDLDKTTSEGIVYGGIHVYDEQGRFLDTVNYNTRINYGSQSTFDKNLRQKLIDEGRRDNNGNLYTETSFIDVNSLSPEDFSIDMFSADDLWNNGNTFIAYYGYDYKGNRQRVQPSLNAFLNDPQNRAVGSFSPIYSAAWVQDKFAFKDLIFRLGVRVERYDANQSVLKDPYSLYPIVTKGEVADLNGTAVNHPDNIGDDYAVYVNNTEQPTRIVGYRDENTWYDANGVQVNSPDVIAVETSSGRIQPMLSDPQNQIITSESFVDYDPQVNVLPRVWFSFPITTEAQFFANYDVMAQRPADGITFLPINQIFFLEQTQGGTIANGSLKPRIRTNYELGFKQKLNDYSAISIIAQYSENRNDFGLIRVYQAYPISYNTYSNIDFSTSKSFRTEYELRGKGRVSLSANYTLQFADGTGSNINSQAALIQANQPNLRTLYPLEGLDVRHKFMAILDYSFEDKANYTGPVWFGKQVFANAGANFIITAKSGTPYTRNQLAISSAQGPLGRVQRSPIDGNPNGSRLPWQFKIDANLTKSFTITKKNPKEYRSKEIQFQAYIWVQNLLNNKIIENVYAYTGLPNDDGYLNSPQGQQYISEQINAQSFVDLYKISMDNPGNYAVPRMARLGVRMYF